MTPSIVGKVVTVYDRYLFGVPVKGYITGVSSHDGAYKVSFFLDNPGGLSVVKHNGKHFHEEQCRIKQDPITPGYVMGVDLADQEDLKKPVQKTTLPIDSAKRKNYPMCSGLLEYFPAACAGVSGISKDGNDKHNPGQPLHHSRGKSNDHSDCIIRHQIDLKEDFGKGVGRDEKGVPQVLYSAWRALAQAQEWLEEHDNAPLAPRAKL